MKPVPTFISLAIVIGGISLVACAETFAPAPEPPTATPLAASAATLTAPDPARGQQVYLDKQCVACHGSQGEGGVGPQLAGTTLPFDQFLHKVRTALPPKPAFSDTELPTQDVHHIYGWLQSLAQTGTSAAVAAPILPTGQVLGMKVWTEGKCDTCHGAFAQGSPNGSTLAGLDFPFELERAKMRRTADTIPEHAAEHMDDTLFQRLYKWLQAGANPDDGC